MTTRVKHLSEDGATQITTMAWPDALAGTSQMARKFALQNVGDRTLNALAIAIAGFGANDGRTMLRTALDTLTVIEPWGATATLSGPGSGGIWAATGTRGWRVTAVNATGQTLGSVEVTANVDDVTKRVTLAWQGVVGATGYKVYRTDTPGTYGASSLRATLAVTTSYDDTGGATAAGSPPTANTTGGWVPTATLSGGGAGGVWSGTGSRYWRVAARDAVGNTIAASTEVTANVDDVTKTVTVAWAAVPDAVQYAVYRSTTPGSYPSPSLRATVTATSYVDNGGATVAGTLTTTASYGIPPASSGFGTAALLAGALGVNQSFYYWVNRVVPSNTPEEGNPRVALLTIQET